MAGFFVVVGMDTCVRVVVVVDGLMDDDNRRCSPMVCAGLVVGDEVFDEIGHVVVVVVAVAVASNGKSSIIFTIVIVIVHPPPNHGKGI